MKKRIITILFVLISINAFSQSLFVNIVCDSINSKRAYCSSFTNLNNHNAEVFGPGVNSGGGYTADDLLQTDLSLLQPNAIIDSAFLELSPDSNWNNINPGGTEDNSVTISLITGIWNQNTVNYTSEPTYSTNNQIIIPASTLSFHYNKFDVTSWIQNWVSQPLSNYGLRLSPINISGTSQRRYCWASSTNPKVNIRPKYKIYYKNNGVGYLNTNISDVTIVVDNNSFKIISKNSIFKLESFTVSNLIGQVVSNFKINSEGNNTYTFPFNQNDMVSGLYFLTLKTNEGNIYKKIILH
ncbi:MAG: Disaggregatase related repeat [Bacteroidota bacterium]|jgi:hypothetical protein